MEMHCTGRYTIHSIVDFTKERSTNESEVWLCMQIRHNKSDCFSLYLGALDDNSIELWMVMNFIYF